MSRRIRNGGSPFLLPCKNILHCAVLICSNLGYHSLVCSSFAELIQSFLRYIINDRVFFACFSRDRAYRSILTTIRGIKSLSTHFPERKASRTALRPSICSLIICPLRFPYGSVRSSVCNLLLNINIPSTPQTLLPFGESAIVACFAMVGECALRPLR